MQNNNINKELISAVSGGNLEKVKALLSAGANATLREERDSDTLLHISRSVEITKELLLAGARVNATNQYRETPLHAAITKYRGLELVGELLKQGADVNATNRKGNTALNHAVKQSGPNLAVVKELLKYGADINIRNRERRLWDNCYSSLDNAVNDLACAELLIKFALFNNFDNDYEKIVDLSRYERVTNYSKLSSYLDDCVCEILQMKTDKIRGSLTLWDFVGNKSNIHILYHEIDYAAVVVRYPIYNDIILDKLKSLLERADLLSQLSHIQFYTKLDMTNQNVGGKEIFLDHDSTYTITEYLSNDDLFNFIVAFDNTNRRTLQSISSLNNLLEPGIRVHETFPSNECKRARLE